MNNSSGVPVASLLVSVCEVVIASLSVVEFLLSLPNIPVVTIYKEEGLCPFGESPA